MLYEVRIARNDAGQRTDRYIRKLLPRLSLDRMQFLFRRKEIKISKKPVKRDYSLREDDILQLYGLRADEMPMESASRPRPLQEFSKPLGMDILFEDEDILAIDKPPNVAVHPGTSIQPGCSIIEMVWAYLSTNSGKVGFSELSVSENPEVFIPALVHRLDRETSGVLLVAKTGSSLRQLTEALRDRKSRKHYLTLVEGYPALERDRIIGNLVRVDSRAGGAKSLVSTEEGKLSITEYQVVKKIGPFSLLDVIIETGRLHQIRAHLSHIGHPVVGDSRYGVFERNRQYKKLFGLKRCFLHASKLDLFLQNGRRLSFKAPLPSDLMDCMEAIEKESCPLP